MLRYTAVTRPALNISDRKSVPAGMAKRELSCLPDPQAPAGYNLDLAHLQALAAGGGLHLFGSLWQEDASLQFLTRLPVFTLPGASPVKANGSHAHGTAAALKSPWAQTKGRENQPPPQPSQDGPMYVSVEAVRPRAPQAGFGTASPRRKDRQIDYGPRLALCPNPNVVKKRIAAASFGTAPREAGNRSAEAAVRSPTRRSADGPISHPDQAWNRTAASAPSPLPRPATPPPCRASTAIAAPTFGFAPRWPAPKVKPDPTPSPALDTIAAADRVLPKKTATYFGFAERFPQQAGPARNPAAADLDSGVAAAAGYLRPHTPCVSWDRPKTTPRRPNPAARSSQHTRAKHQSAASRPATAPIAGTAGAAAVHSSWHQRPDLEGAVSKYDLASTQNRCPAAQQATTRQPPHRHTFQKQRQRCPESCRSVDANPDQEPACMAASAGRGSPGPELEAAGKQSVLSPTYTAVQKKAPAVSFAAASPRKPATAGTGCTAELGPGCYEANVGALSTTKRTSAPSFGLPPPKVPKLRRYSILEEAATAPGQAVDIAKATVAVKQRPPAYKFPAAPRMTPEKADTAAPQPALDPKFDLVETRAHVVVWKAPVAKPKTVIEELPAAAEEPDDTGYDHRDDPDAGVRARKPAWQFATTPARPLEEEQPEPQQELNPDYEVIKPAAPRVPGFELQVARNLLGDDASAVARRRRTHRRPDVGQYSLDRAWEYLERHAPAALLGWGALRWKEQAATGPQRPPQQELWELAAAVHAVRPAPPAWTFVPTARWAEGAPGGRQRRTRGFGPMLSYDLDFTLVRKRLPGGLQWEELEGRLEHRRKRQYKAELGRYEPAYDLVEPAPRRADFANRGMRFSMDDQATTGWRRQEGDILELDLTAAEAVVRPAHAAIINMERTGGRDRGAGGPRPAGQETRTIGMRGADLDLPLRAHVPTVKIEGCTGHKALYEPAGDAEAREIEAKRGPGAYLVEQHKALGADAPAVDFGHASGRPVPAAKDEPVEGDVLDLQPNDGPLRPAPPSVLILPEGQHAWRRDGEFDTPDVMYDPRWDAVRTAAPHPIDFRKMLPRDTGEPSQEGHAAVDYHVEDIPLSILAEHRGAPAGPSFATMLPRPVAAELDFDERGSLDVAAADKLTLPSAPRPPNLAVGDGHRGGAANQADLTCELDYDPKLDLIRPAPSAVPAFDLQVVQEGGAETDDLDAGVYSPRYSLVHRQAPEFHFPLADRVMALAAMPGSVPGADQGLGQAHEAGAAPADEARKLQDRLPGPAFGQSQQRWKDVQPHGPMLEDPEGFMRPGSPATTFARAKRAVPKLALLADDASHRLRLPGASAPSSAIQMATSLRMWGTVKGPTTAGQELPPVQPHRRGQFIPGQVDPLSPRALLAVGPASAGNAAAASWLANMPARELLETAGGMPLPAGKPHPSSRPLHPAEMTHTGALLVQRGEQPAAEPQSRTSTAVDKPDASLLPEKPLRKPLSADQLRGLGAADTEAGDAEAVSTQAHDGSALEYSAATRSVVSRSTASLRDTSQPAKKVQAASTQAHNGSALERSLHEAPSSLQAGSTRANDGSAIQTPSRASEAVQAASTQANNGSALASSLQTSSAPFTSVRAASPHAHDGGATQALSRASSSVQPGSTQANHGSASLLTSLKATGPAVTSLSVLSRLASATFASTGASSSDVAAASVQSHDGSASEASRHTTTQGGSQDSKQATEGSLQASLRRAVNEGIFGDVSNVSHQGTQGSVYGSITGRGAAYAIQQPLHSQVPAGGLIGHRHASAGFHAYQRDSLRRPASGPATGPGHQPARHLQSANSQSHEAKMEHQKPSQLAGPTKTAMTRPVHPAEATSGSVIWRPEIFSRPGSPASNAGATAWQAQVQSCAFSRPGSAASEGEIHQWRIQALPGAETPSGMLRARAGTFESRSAQDDVAGLLHAAHTSPPAGRMGQHHSQQACQQADITQAGTYSSSEPHDMHTPQQQQQRPAQLQLRKPHGQPASRSTGPDHLRVVVHPGRSLELGGLSIADEEPTTSYVDSTLAVPSQGQAGNKVERQRRSEPAFLQRAVHKLRLRSSADRHWEPVSME